MTNVIDDSTIVYPTGQSDCYCCEKQSEDGWNADYYVEGHSKTTIGNYRNLKLTA